MTELDLHDEPTDLDDVSAESTMDLADLPLLVGCLRCDELVAQAAKSS